MTKQTKEEQKAAGEKIREIRNKITALVNEAEAIADQSGVDFTLNISYGMGGTYNPNPARINEWAGDPEDYDYEQNEDGTYSHAGHFADYGAEDDEGFWYSSSMSC